MKTLVLAAITALLAASAVPAFASDTAVGAVHNDAVNSSNVKVRTLRFRHADRQIALRVSKADQKVEQANQDGLGYGTEMFVIQ